MVQRTAATQTLLTPLALTVKNNSRMKYESWDHRQETCSITLNDSQLYALLLNSGGFNALTQINMFRKPF